MAAKTLAGKSALITGGLLPATCHCATACRVMWTRSTQRASFCRRLRVTPGPGLRHTAGTGGGRR